MTTTASDHGRSPSVETDALVSYLLCETPRPMQFDIQYVARSKAGRSSPATELQEYFTAMRVGMFDRSVDEAERQELTRLFDAVGALDRVDWDHVAGALS